MTMKALLPKLEPRALRQAFGQFPTGVTVITSVLDGRVHGMTANSFTSVSLDPALLLVSIGHHARMPAAIRQSGLFGLSVLSADQQPISRHFSRKDSNMAVEFETLGDVAVIANGIACFACSLYAEHTAGDHSLFIGEISDFTIRNNAPLLFHAGDYHSLLPELLPASGGYGG